MSTIREKSYTELKQRLHEVNDLNKAAYVLMWDQSTYMPSGGASARGRQLATLQKIAHEKFTDPAIGHLLDQLMVANNKLPYDSDEASLLRVTHRQYERAIKVPAEFAASIAGHAADSYAAWAEARPANDFAKVRPFLQKTLDLSRRYADFFPGYEHPADPLIDGSDYGMKASTVRKIFADLRAGLVPLVRAIGEKSESDDSCLHQHYPEAAQWEFGLEIAKEIGYDLNRGRQDKTLHPFAIPFSINDVRITTRFNEEDLGDGGLFSTIHEVGHAIYEQGISTAYEATPLAAGTSSGVHESQSRLWENIVGRSRGFWAHYYPQLQAKFPDQLASVDVDEFYRAINKVQRSLIRTDADEVTYNLHVIIRFDLELAMLEGTLSIDDLPAAWHDRYEADLGVRAPNDSDGVLQDVHWYGGLIGGAFQGYALGNILASQFYAKAIEAHPEIPQQIATGQLDPLHTWLRKNIYTHGSKFTAPELIERVTGGEMALEPYFGYLKSKYGEIYGL